jgi:small multidrug resistance pump
MIVLSTDRRFEKKSRFILRAAGIYNMIFGAWVILFPLSVFEWLSMIPPNYPELWQCIGMIVGVYGVGYWIAASDPIRYWPIILVGFLGKIFGPIGFAKALYEGVFPLEFGWIIIGNDLIWWAPFAWLLMRISRSSRDSG